MPAPLVSYVLLAEFDIDKGSTLRHAYPSTIPHYEDAYFAESMLPEGAHNREMDWTTIFLNRDVEIAARAVESAPASAPASAQAEAPAPQPPVDVSIVHFEPDSQQWAADAAGAGVRLVLTADALELRATGDQADVLDSIPLEASLSFTREADGSVLHRDVGSTERGAGLQFASAAAADAFLERLEQAKTPGGSSSSSSSPGADPFLYCINLVRTKHDDSVRRGAIVKALLVASPYPFVHVFKPMLVMALDEFYDSGEEQVLARLFDRLNGMDVGELPPFSATQYRLMTRDVKPTQGLIGGDAWHRQLVLPWGESVEMPVSVPLCVPPDLAGEVSVLELVRVFGEQIMDIYNAVLTGQRLLFCGYNRPAGEVCNLVKAACALIAPPLRGVVQRAFPYANLNDLDWLTVPGFIAGVTNPMFESKPDWWDVLCDLPSKRVTLQAEAKKAQAEAHGGHSHSHHDDGDGDEVSSAQPHDEMDARFVAHLLAGVEDMHYGEEWVRMMFQRYTEAIADLAFGDALFDASDAEAELAARAAQEARTAKWRCTNTFENAQADRADPTPFSRAFDTAQTGAVDLLGFLRALRSHKDGSLDDEWVEVAFDAFVALLQTENDLLELISHLPEDKGGLYPIAVGLMHPSESVRFNAVRLLQRLEAHPSTKPAVDGLDFMLALAYSRVAASLASGGASAGAGEAVEGAVETVSPL